MSSELAIYYCTVLFLLRRYTCCERALQIALKIVEKSKDKKGEANLRRLKGCLFIVWNQYKNALDEFKESLDLFKETGVNLGMAIAHAAIPSRSIPARRVNGVPILARRVS